MIVILTGPIGSGKTDTASELLKIFNNTVFLDCDWFASMQPFSWDKKSDVAMVYELLIQMIDFHCKRGIKRFVITLNSQMAAVYCEYQSHFISKNIPVYAFRLRCSDQTLLQRIEIRNQANKSQEKHDALKQQKFYDTRFAANIPFMLVDVERLNQAEVVRKVRNMINDYSKLQKAG